MTARPGRVPSGIVGFVSAQSSARTPSAQSNLSNYNPPSCGTCRDLLTFASSLVTFSRPPEEFRLHLITRPRPVFIHLHCSVFYRKLLLAAPLSRYTFASWCDIVVTELSSSLEEERRLHLEVYCIYPNICHYPLPLSYTLPPPPFPSSHFLPWKGWCE